MTKPPRLRIANNDDIAGSNTHIYLGDEDITEALLVTNIDISMKVGEPARAALTCLCVHGDVDVVVDKIMFAHVGHSRLGRLGWRLRRRWWHTWRGRA